MQSHGSRKDIKDKWDTYFFNLLNERYDISPDSNMLEIREDDWNYNYYSQIKKQEVEKSIKKDE